MAIRAEPNIEGRKTDKVLSPGEAFYVCSEQEGADGVLALRLSDGRGYVFDRKPGFGQLCHRVDAMLWHYVGSAPIYTRLRPQLDSPVRPEVLKPGEAFYVLDEKVNAAGLRFLELADGRGWVVEGLPGQKPLCQCHEAVLRRLSSDADKSELWRHAAADGKPIYIRAEPRINGRQTAELLQPGEVFRVSEELLGANGILYLRLEDGRGWLFDRKPGVGVLCARHQAPVKLHIYDVRRTKAAQRLNGVFRRLGTGAFHAGVEVYGKEWSFGCSDHGEGTGVFSGEPRGCEAHAYREEVFMGHTALTEEQFLALIEIMSSLWSSEDYDLLRRNCCHFSDSLCQQLGVGPIPSWVRNLASVGAALDDRRRLIATSARGLLGSSGAGERLSGLRCGGQFCSAREAMLCSGAPMRSGSCFSSCSGSSRFAQEFQSTVSGASEASQEDEEEESRVGRRFGLRRFNEIGRAFLRNLNCVS